MGAFPVNTYSTYQSRAVFVTSGSYDTDQTVSGSLRQLARVQSLDWNIPYPVQQVTYLDNAEEAYLGSHNPVDVTLGWYHTNGRNEQYLGLLDIVGPQGQPVGTCDGPSTDDHLRHECACRWSHPIASHAQLPHHVLLYGVGGQSRACGQLQRW